MTSRLQATRNAILERRRVSGLGTGCTDAQADGVPCPEQDRDCEKCDKAAEAVKGSRATAKTRARA